MITSPSNERLKLVRKLRERRWRDKLELFVAEGEDLLDSARAASIEPVDVLRAGEDVLPELLAGVATLGHPPRVVAVFRRDGLARGEREVGLALWQVGDPGNVGTLVRAADAFGASVALSPGCADPVGPRALRASAGAIFRVPLVAFEDAPGRRIALVAHGGRPLAEVDLTPPLSFVAGAERDGLPAELVSRSDEAASIALPGDAESLNVAMAGTVALYELSRRAAASGS